ncbi:hypothetical protein C3489_09460 [Streptomyces sp. Ru71]|uniref:hypothetical protein n=1 Tax=Streptomyces sp. Ru71 TaxID=2080746 RepID=UPI000CDCFBF4|nr:hypothetical protein [Streptomyces sp. Ru71]POX55538.1 hypothetical protein C3489_09460 [Streptomyces sp. Ru71]
MTSLPGSGDIGDNGGPPDRPGPPVCARCGVTATEPQPATWTFSVENGVRRYFCDACSRENLRAIEGRLDSGWW